MLYSDEQRLEDGKRRNRIGKWKIPQRKKRKEDCNQGWLEVIILIIKRQRHMH